MHKFYFNDCLPANTLSLNEFASLLANSIREFDFLVRKGINVEKGIILEKETEQIVVCDSNLKQAILAISNKDRDIRTLAFAYFTKYPIHYHLESRDLEEQILEEQYHFNNLDATNLALAQNNACILFSVAVFETIKNNTLQIEGIRRKFVIDNLYGEVINTKYIESQLIKINNASLNSFELLKVELGTPIFTSSFEKAFKAAQVEVQKSIIDGFNTARKRKLISPYLPDNKARGLIKDVSPDNNSKKDAKVYELRIYHPEAIRVYFFEYDKNVFLSSICYKKDYKESSGSAQTIDITKALNDIDKLIKTR